MPFQKIVAEKISAAVVRQIEELILQGVLRPGERLPSERDLAETMEVSRPTLREALADLESRGLVLARPGGGTFVAEVLGSAFSPALIELFATHDTALFDYIAFRRDVEGLAAARAATHATEADLEILARVHGRLQDASAAGDNALATRLDAEFHLAIVEAAHNVMLLHMMRSLFELLQQGVFHNTRVVYALPDGVAALAQQHREIYDAIVARDPLAARAAVEAHMDYVRDVMREADRRRTREEVARLRHVHELRRQARERRTPRAVG